MRNDEFESPTGSYFVSDIQDYVRYIIKKYKKLTNNPPLNIYFKKTYNGLVFKVKDGYKLELQTPVITNKF